ncbi:MAG: hypothetical protein R3C26_00715 [Calditrichia bacterium]
MVQSAMLNKPDAVLSYEQIDELLTRLLAAPTESDARQFWGSSGFCRHFSQTEHPAGTDFRGSQRCGNFQN